MSPLSAQLGSDGSVDAVLRIVRADELRLFVAAASMALGLVIVGFSLIRKRFDRLLLFLAWFAFVYGARLWLQSGIHHLMAPATAAANRLQMILDFFVAIPAFLFFGETGAGGRAGRVLVNIVCVSALILMAAVLFGLPWLPLDRANSVLIIAASTSLLLLAVRQSPATKDEVVFRAGLIVFVALVLWTNISQLLGHSQGLSSTVSPSSYAASVTLPPGERSTAINSGGRFSRNSISRAAFRCRFFQLLPRLTGFPCSHSIQSHDLGGRGLLQFLQAEDGGLGLLVADVSGHGVPAALIASMVKVAVQSQRHKQDDPAALLAAVNQALCGNAQNQFVTAAYVYLDARSSELRYAAAGHPPMLLLRDGEVISIEENGLVMALMPSAIYTSRSIGLHPGDRILLYTDGILEPIDASEEEFGPERLIRLVKESAMQSPDEAADLILGAVTAWPGPPVSRMTSPS